MPQVNSEKNKMTLAIVLKIVGVLITLSLSMQSCSRITSNAESARSKDQASQQATGVPKEGHLEAYFFPEINRRLEKAIIGKLKDEKIPAGSKEIRFWGSFSADRLKGLILRSDNGKWSAIYIPQLDKASASSGAPRSLSSPKSGWDALLKRIQDLGAFDLPGEPDEVPGRLHVSDLPVTVVEIKTSDSYRAYKYVGLQYYKEPQTKKLEEIIDILSSEFGIELY